MEKSSFDIFLNINILFLKVICNVITFLLTKAFLPNVLCTVAYECVSWYLNTQYRIVSYRIVSYCTC